MYSFFIGTLFIVLTILVIALPVLIVYSLIRKKYTLLKALIGLIALLAAFPIGLLIEFSSGCCGARTSGSGGVGYIVGFAVGLTGLAMLVASIKTLSTQRKSR
jgi:heme exporter protein D